ncbi:PNPOx family protein [Paenibacillus aestuarii]|uniref:Uncharacterized protein n=1 Tax=Paenibacillus aestuarii TaxID=516965 RepID=A0ABW0KCI5_9BACL|nr:hypothetical protein [Paenibacillus aestuarii]
MAEHITVIPEQLYPDLHNKNFERLNIFDVETVAPCVHADSWIDAKDRATLRFAVDARSRIVSNLRKYPAVSLSVVGTGSVHAFLTEDVRAAAKLDGQVFNAMKKA